jgi:hypothetical protein
MNGIDFITYIIGQDQLDLLDFYSLIPKIDEDKN